MEVVFIEGSKTSLRQVMVERERAWEMIQLYVDYWGELVIREVPYFHVKIHLDNRKKSCQKLVALQKNSRCLLLSFPKDCQKLKLWKLCLYINPFAMPNTFLSL